MKKLYNAPTIDVVELSEKTTVLSGSDDSRFSDQRPGQGPTGGEDASTGDDYGDARTKDTWTGLDDSWSGWED